MMKLCDGPVVYDPGTGSVICADNGLVLATDVPASLFGGEERSPVRERERMEEYELRIRRVERRYRNSASYRRIVEIRRRYRFSRKRVFSEEEIRIVAKVIRGEITTWEAAKQLNTSPKTVYNWVRKLMDDLDKLLLTALNSSM